MWDVTTYADPYFNIGLVTPPLMFGWIVTHLRLQPHPPRANELQIESTLVYDENFDAFGLSFCTSESHYLHKDYE